MTPFLLFSLYFAFDPFSVSADNAHNGIVEMKILVDDKEVFATGKVSSRSYNAKVLDIPVAGAKKLTLIVTDVDNGAGGDHASWADAYLTVRSSE